MRTNPLNIKQVQNNTNEKGFSLLEIAIVFIIFGIIVGAALPIYHNYLEQKARDDTQLTIETALSAIGTFRAAYGRYPCPAPPFADREDPEYGHEAAICNLDDTAQVTAIADGNCDTTDGSANHGICIETAITGRTIDHDDNTATAEIAPRVVVGTLPFRRLNLSEAEFIDGYGNLIRYAVTEDLARDGGFQPDFGGIEILDANGNSLTAVNGADAGSAHFIVLSHGANAFGAYDQNGAQTPCPGVASPESQNCDTDGTAQYQVSDANSDFGSTDEYDDVASYYLQDDVTYWQLADPTAPGADPLTDADDMHLRLNEGQVAVDVPINQTITEELEVTGLLRARASLGAEEICDTTGDCFPTSLIAGTGMDCTTASTPGTFAMGIGDGELKCVDEITVRCPPGQFMTGVDSAGEILCNAPPPKCAATTLNLCGTSDSLPQGDVGDTHTLTFTTQTRVYQCQTSDGINASWVNTSTSGICNCDSTTVLATKTTGCSSCRTGTRDWELRRQCPSGNLKWYLIASNCTCVPGSDCKIGRTLSCPPGYSGKKREENILTCKADGTGLTAGGWKLVLDTCVCPAQPDQTRTLACSGVETGAITEMRSFSTATCSWGTWGPVSDTCACDPTRTQQRTEPCPYGYVGDITEERAIDCGASDWGPWKEISNTCTPDPNIVICKWKKKGSPSGPPSNNALGSSAGSTCACGSVGPCFRSVASKFQNFTSCSCE